MTRQELNALKAKALERKTKAEDLEVMAVKLFGLLDSFSAILPEEVKAILKRYANKEDAA